MSLKHKKEFNDYTVTNTTKIFYSGSACMYPEHNQLDPNNPDCREESAYPANPDSEYGWEKLFSKDFTWLYNLIILFLFVLLGITISLVQKEPGREEERKQAAICRNGSLTSLRQVEASRCGEMGYKLVPSCSLMNALKQLEG